MGRATLTFLCLWSCIVMVSPLNDTDVHNAMDYIRSTFKLAGAKQHAFVAVFTQEECQSLSSNNNSLQIFHDENAKDIAEVLKDDKKIYEGNQLVLATFQQKGKNYIHSEYRLLYPPSGSTVSPVQNLLNKNSKADCVLFYTLNSPCAGRCANEEDNKNIINKLSVFDKFNNKNNKAFVYNKLYKKDVETDKTKENIWAGLTTINNNMDVYRCSNTTCYSCFKKDNNKLTNKDNCLKENLQSYLQNNNNHTLEMLSDDKLQSHTSR